MRGRIYKKGGLAFSALDFDLTKATIMFSTSFCAPYFSLIVFLIICGRGLEAGNAQNFGFPSASASGSDAAGSTVTDMVNRAVIRFIDADTGAVTGGCVTTHNGATTLLVPSPSWQQIQSAPVIATNSDGGIHIRSDSSFTMGDQRLVGLPFNRRIAEPIPKAPPVATSAGNPVIAATWNNGNLVPRSFRVIKTSFCGLEPVSGSDVRYICAVSNEDEGKIDVGNGFPLFTWYNEKLALLGIQTEYFEETGNNLFVIPK